MSRVSTNVVSKPIVLGTLGVLALASSAAAQQKPSSPYVIPISEAVTNQLAQMQDTSQPAAPEEQAPEWQRKKFRVGIDAGIYLPTQSRLTDIFGKAVYKLGLDLGTREKILNGRFTPSISLISAHKDGNDFYLGQLLGTYQVRLAPPSEWAKGLTVEPYGSFGLGLAYADYSITDRTNVHYGAKHILPTGQGQVGLLVGHRLRISASYDFFSSIDSFNFNGFALSVAYTVFRF
jgi:hypothetical protein